MTFRRYAVLVAASAALVLAGCAGQTAGQTAGSAPAGSTAPASAPVSTEPSASQPDAHGTETITGTVSAGVEPGCLLLKGGTGQHLLVFTDPALRAEAKAGATITVTGRAEPDRLTTCQQGVPFIVTAVQAN